MTLLTSATATQFLAPGHKVAIRGVEYIITATKPKNYGIVSLADGKMYNIDRRAAMTDLGRDNEAYGRILSESAPKLHPGQRVQVKQDGSKWAGRKGTLLRVNAKRYSIALDGAGPYDGNLLAPFSAIEAI